MSFVYDQKVVDSMYGSHVVSMAVDYGVDLVKMWPLQTNQELENDVKYAENLQVMFSGMMTQVLLKRSEEVDQSVAEAVYEGMDVLPGVDPEIIRTLMDANRAYDVMASYHGVDGIELFMETARILGIDVETRIEKEIQDLMENLSRTMRSASGFEVDDDVAENVGICQSATVDRNEFARRYLASMTVLRSRPSACCRCCCSSTPCASSCRFRPLSSTPNSSSTCLVCVTPPASSDGPSRCSTARSTR